MGAGGMSGSLVEVWASWAAARARRCVPKTCAREPTARCHAGLTAQTATVVRRDRGQAALGSNGDSCQTGWPWSGRLVEQCRVELEARESGQTGSGRTGQSIWSKGPVVYLGSGQTRDSDEAVKLDTGQTGKWWNRACDDAGQWSKGAADGMRRWRIP